MRELENLTELLLALRRVKSAILVVDEQAESRALARHFFEQLGCQVMAVGSLEIAAQLLRSIPVGLVFARYEEERAQAAASTLRGCAPDVPIIAVSADGRTLQALIDALEKSLHHEAAPN